MATENHLLTMEALDSTEEVTSVTKNFGMAKLAAAVSGLTLLVAGSALVLRPGRDSRGASFDHAINKASAPIDHFDFEKRFGAILAGKSYDEIRTIDECVRGGACPDIFEADEMETLQSWYSSASSEERSNHDATAADMLQGVSGSVDVSPAVQEVEFADESFDDWAVGGSQTEVFEGTAVDDGLGSAEGALGSSLFCFIVVLPDSGDVALQEIAQQRGAGIYSCDANAVYQGVRTGTYDTPDGQFSANAGVFAHIWKEVAADGFYKSHDWTVKADPDTVFLAQRVRERLQSTGRVDKNEATYIKNTAIIPWGFLGPIEVMTKAAVDVLTEKVASKCTAGDTEGEDGWLNDCLENHLSIPARVDSNFLYSGCQIDSCGDATYVAYHYYKDAGSWGSCLDRMR